MNFQYLHQGGLSSTSTVAGPFRKDHDWPLFFKFLAISSVATFASIGNIFTISAIIIDDLLRKKGNSFLVSVTLADLLATTFMLPASSVAILSQMENSENLCRFQYAVAEMSCMTAAVFTAVVGIENFLRLSTLQQVEKHRRRRQHHQQQQQQRQQRQQQQQQRQQQHSLHHHHQQQHQHQSHGSGSISSTTAASSTTTTQPRSASITIQILPSNERSDAPSPPPVSPYRCSQFQVTVSNLTLWVVSGSLVLFHVLLWPQPMYAVCGFFDDRGLDRESLIHSLIIFAICFTTFLLVGGLGFLKCVYIMKSWDRPKPYLISREFALVTSNCWNWLARFLIWCPSLLIAIITHSQESSNSLLPIVASTSATMTVSSTDATALLHHVGSSNSLSSNIISSTVSPLLQLSSNGVHHTNSSRITASELISLQGLLLWPAILPPCLSSLINALSNKDFRRCYIQLFHYCCCKTSVALTRRSRDNLRGGSDVRVHIIPGYNIYNSGTTGHFNEVAATPPRFNTFKYGSLMACRRDVYEL